MNSDTRPELNRLGFVRAIGLIIGQELFGYQRGNIEWFKALRREGAKLTIGVSKADGKNKVKDHLESLGFEVFEIPFGCQWSKKFFLKSPRLIATNLFKVFRSSIILASQVRLHKATHILLGNALPYTFVAPYLIWNKNLKLIYRMGDEPSHDSKPNLWIWRKCFARATAVVANSEFVRSSIQRAIGDSKKLGLIYNVAPFSDFDFMSDTSFKMTSARAKRVLFVGQIASHKGVDLLVEAAIRICQCDTEFHFDLLGSSLYTKHFEETLVQHVHKANLADRIVFHGHVSDPGAFYSRSSVLVVPSVFEEPAANVVLEAKRMGLPAIVFPSGGLPELVQHGETGIICADRTVDSLTAEILSLCNAQDRIEQMKRRCLQEYEVRFSQARFDLQWSSVIVNS